MHANYLLPIIIDKIQLKCSQTGRKFTAKLCEISTEDGDAISTVAIVPGLEVIADVEGTPYPAQVIAIEGSSDIAIAA